MRGAVAAPRVPLLARAARRGPLLELDVLHRRRTAEVERDGVRLQRVLALDRLSLLGLEVVYADLPTAAAAREVRWLVEEDGEAFEPLRELAGSFSTPAE